MNCPNCKNIELIEYEDKDSSIKESVDLYKNLMSKFSESCKKNNLVLGAQAFKCDVCGYSEVNLGSLKPALENKNEV